MSRGKLLRILVPALLAALLLAAAGLFLLREKIRADRQREAEAFRFTGASLTVDRFVTAPGETVTFTASAQGGKGELLYEFYTLDGEEKTVIREAAPQNTASFSSDAPRLYEVFVRISDESPMTGDVTAGCRYGAAKKGIDVSLYQGDVDWGAVRASGYEFAVIRTGHGGEETYKDPKFGANAAGAKAAGLQIGAYHYSYATTPEEAREEAALCLSVLGETPLDLPVFFDVEREEQQGLAEADLAAVVDAFCGAIAEAGYTPAVYTFDSWLQVHPDWRELSRYDLWVANWSGAPATENAFTLWQYSNAGIVDGIDGAVDLNYIFCDYENGKRR